MSEPHTIVVADALEKLCRAGFDIGEIRTGGATSIWIKKVKLTSKGLIYATVSFCPLGEEVVTSGPSIPIQKTSDLLAKAILDEIRSRALKLKEEVDEMVADLDVAEEVLGDAESDMLEFIQCV